MKKLWDYFEEIEGKINTDHFIDLSKSIRENEGDLFEDMIQIIFDERIVLDFGWYYLDHLNKGVFKISIIRDFDWDAPCKLYWKEHQDELLFMMEEAFADVERRTGIKAPTRK